MAKPLTLIDIIKLYHVPFERYVRHITPSEAVAEKIAKFALELYYEEKKNIADEDIRLYHKKYALKFCEYWHLLGMPPGIKIYYQKKIIA